MTKQNLKQISNGILAIVAFLFGICINPTDDSPTFFEDFFKVKLIAAAAMLLLAFINRNPKPSSHPM